MTRMRLLNRRPAETFDLQAGGLRYTCTIGRFPDGRLAEIFLANHRCDSDADTAARDSAIVCSLALQHGTDPEVIRRALCRMPMAQRAVRSASRSISSSDKKDRELVR